MKLEFENKQLKDDVDILKKRPPFFPRTSVSYKLIKDLQKKASLQVVVRVVSQAY